MPSGIEVFRYGYPFGQQSILGLSWDVLLVFATVAMFIFLVHFIIRELLNTDVHGTPEEEASKAEVRDSLVAQGVDEVERFTAAQRASHWIMAISIFLLMLSGFLIMNHSVTVKSALGLSWILVHEVSAIVLIAYVIYHVGRVLSVGTFWEMWFGITDAKDLWARGKNLFGVSDTYPRQFKYPSAQKLLHWSVTGTTLGLIVTGLVLLRRVQTPLWAATREFSFLGIKFGLGGPTLGQMGLIPWSFVLHDFLAISTVALVIGHVYFGLRPEEWDITKSMVTGRIPVAAYAEKYSPRSWPVGGTVETDGGRGEDADDE